MIIGKSDLEKFFKVGILGISRRKKTPNFSAFSLDLRVGELYRHNHEWNTLIHEGRIPSRGKAPEDMPTEEYVAAFLNRVNLPFEGRVIPAGHYIWRPLEEISLDGHCQFKFGKKIQKVPLRGEIVSRSSWARRSLRVQEAEDDLSMFGVGYVGRPLCAFTTQAPIVMRPKDSIAQFVITAGVDYPIVPEKEIAYLIDSGEMIIRRDDTNLTSSDLVFKQGGIVLTMDKYIKVYNGDIIDPVTSSNHAFEYVDIQNGYVVSKKDFFISSSAEYIEIPDGYVGYVTEFNFFQFDFGDIDFTGGPDPTFWPFGFQVHPNAPYIGPQSVFKGTITFENNVGLEDIKIYPGHHQSILQLKRLSSVPDDAEESRYRNQKGATLSR